MSVAAMRRFFYPFDGIDLPIGWMCCPTARIQKNKQEEIMELNNKTLVYYETAAYARENGELELFRLSHRTNIACKNDIQDAISRHFDGMHLDKETAKEVLDQYGAERVSIVLAATVQYKSWDSRFSSSNKDWAFSVHLPEAHTVFLPNRPIESRMWYNVMGDERWQNHMRYPKVSWRKLRRRERRTETKT